MKLSIKQRLLPALVAASAVAFIIPVPASAAPKPVDVSRVVLVGDSLAFESAPALAWLTAPRTFVPRYYGGTAPCDWTKKGLGANKAAIVVISFTGNSLTPCMSDGLGGFLADDALLFKYSNDISVLITQARRVGAQVLLVGQPARPSDRLEENYIVDGLNAMYRAYARAPHVSFVDAGSVVENADGTHTEVLPCASWEGGCNTDGAKTVRNADGVHFCPKWNAAKNACAVYASGSLRFALAIADAATHPQAFE